jgi:hypothetical protein
MILQPALHTPHYVPGTRSRSCCLFVFLILILLSSVSCILKKGLVEPGTIIIPFGDTVHLREGSLVYSLPQTVLNFRIDVERRIEKPGPYAKFAGDLLGLKDVITQEKETWSITGITLFSTEEPDPSEIYLIETNTLFQTNVLALKESGLILDLNSDIYERQTETGTRKASSSGRIGFNDLGSNEYFVTQSDTAFRLVKLDTAFIRIPYLVEKKKQLTIDQLAEKASKSLLELRDGKHLILTGEANVFPQDKSSIDEINRMEKEYLDLFAGKVWSETETLYYTLIPKKDDKGKPVSLLRFSLQTGPSDATGNSGTPVTMRLAPSQNMRKITVVPRQLPPNGPLPKYDKLYYRVPEIVTVEIKMGNERLFSGRKLIYQFGQVVQLPGNYIIGK